MPAESNNQPPGQYLGVAPVAFDSAGKAVINRSSIRFAPEFGGVGGHEMFGTLPEGNYQGDYAHGFGTLPEGNYQGDYAHGFGEGGDKVWSNIQRVGLGAEGPVMRRIQPSDLKATAPLNKVVDYGDAVYIRVIADNVRDAADKAALAFTAVEVVEPYAVIPCQRRKGVFHVKAAKVDPTDSMGRRGGSGGGRAGTGGNKMLSPRQVRRYLRGKPVRISRRRDRISVYGFARNRSRALRLAQRAAGRKGIKNANFVNAVPLGNTPVGKLWQVNGRVGSAGKATKESAAEVREQMRTIADTATKFSIGPIVEAAAMVDQAMRVPTPRGAGFYDDQGFEMQASMDEASDGDYVEARYQAAVQALMSDSFGGIPMGNPHGSYVDELGRIPMLNNQGSYVADGGLTELGAIPMLNYHGSYTDELGGSCGCR